VIALSLSLANYFKKKAEELQAQAVEIRKRVLGMEHLDMLVAIANLATTYRANGDGRRRKSCLHK
jgi:hypothetical protein